MKKLDLIRSRYGHGVEKVSRYSSQGNTNRLNYSYSDSRSESKPQDSRDNVADRALNSREISRLVDYTTNNNMENWTVVTEICERINLNDQEADEALRELMDNIQSERSAVQLAAAQLWAIMMYTSPSYFASHIPGQGFLETIEEIVFNANTSVAVRGRLIEVVGASVFWLKDAGTLGPYKSTWMKLRQRLKLKHPSEGIEMTSNHPILNPRSYVGGLTRSRQSPYRPLQEYMATEQDTLAWLGPVPITSTYTAVLIALLDIRISPDEGQITKSILIKKGEMLLFMDQSHSDYSRRWVKIMRNSRNSSIGHLVLVPRNSVEDAESIAVTDTLYDFTATVDGDLTITKHQFVSVHCIEQGWALVSTAATVYGSQRRAGYIPLKCLRFERGVALYSFESPDPSKLSIVKGEILSVLNRTEAPYREWWMCVNSDGKTGIIPPNYLKLQLSRGQAQTPAAIKNSRTSRNWQQTFPSDMGTTNSVLNNPQIPINAMILDEEGTESSLTHNSSSSGISPTDKIHIEPSHFLPLLVDDNGVDTELNAGPKRKRETQLPVPNPRNMEGFEDDINSQRRQPNESSSGTPNWRDCSWEPVATCVGPKSRKQKHQSDGSPLISELSLAASNETLGETQSWLVKSDHTLNQEALLTATSSSLAAEAESNKPGLIPTWTVAIGNTPNRPKGETTPALIKKEPFPNQSKLPLTSPHYCVSSTESSLYADKHNDDGYISTPRPESPQTEVPQLETEEALDLPLKHGSASPSITAPSPTGLAPPTITSSETIDKLNARVDEKEDTLISRWMAAPEVVSHLITHGCKDISSNIDYPSFNDCPSFHGGFSDVYRGQLLDGTLVAMKALRVSEINLTQGPKHLKHAAYELHIWGKCKHPNVMPLLGLSMFRGRIGMVSPWMGKGSLPRYLEGTTEANRGHLCVQICEGLAYVHQNGIIHGDLKGANVLVSDEGVPVLADFGNSLLIDQTMKFTQTTSGITFTVRWSVSNQGIVYQCKALQVKCIQAPEIIEETSPHTNASDIYSLGMTIYEVMTGKVPYHGKSEANVIRLVTVKQEPPERPGVDCLPCHGQNADKLWELLTCCWSYDPEARPSAVEVAAAMKALTA